MRVVAASIIVLSGAVITSAWFVCQAIGTRPASPDAWVALGLFTMAIGGAFFLWSWPDNRPNRPND